MAAALFLCAVLAVGAWALHLAPIVGAYVAGVAFAEFSPKFEIHRRLERPRNALVPLFFVLMGTNVTLGAFYGNIALVAVAAAVLLLACVTKYYPCRLASRRLGRREAHVVGVGMMPRGEVGLIVAAVALASGALSPDLFSVVVLASIGTSIVASPLLRRAVKALESVGYVRLKFARYAGLPARGALREGKAKVARLVPMGAAAGASPVGGIVGASPR